MLTLETPVVSYLGTNWAFVGDVLFYQDERTGHYCRLATLGDPIQYVHQAFHTGRLLVGTIRGDKYEIVVNPAIGPQAAEIVRIP